MVNSDQEFVDLSEISDPSDTDDSQEDPTFDVLDETRLTFSNLSIDRKSKARIAKEMDQRDYEEMDVIEMVVPELDEQDQKSYEAIEAAIKVGAVEKLKVDQCKIYLRKHGLRLSGNKGTLLQRIKEHIDIINGGGERRYPASSFVLNCKGDACTGDIVMFEQNLYEVFNIASRSANGPPCGTRMVAGRIVKESYGAAKQQHTFTIEVLWSKGEKPLPPLHPLLIKGRNLYRLRTMRQKWEDEGERAKILSEKHARGGVARLNREARVQHKAMFKIQKPNRHTKNDHLKKQKGEGNETTNFYNKPSEISIRNQPERSLEMPGNASHAPVEWFHQRPPLVSFSREPHHAYSNPIQGDFPFRGYPPMYFPELNHLRGPSESLFLQEHGMLMRSSGSMHPKQRDAYSWKENNYNSANVNHSSVHVKDGCAKKQACRHFARGTCYFGERCKYLHEL